jgi:hypothetical protein
VPDAEQRLWRMVMRRKYQITRNRVQLHNRLESLLEEAHIKLSSLVSDLLGTSARRMLQALADGETDPATPAALADQRLRATAAQLSDALRACTTLNPVDRRLLKLTLEELRLIEEHLGELDHQMAQLLTAQHEPVQRLAEALGWASIPRSRSLRKSAPPPRRFPHRSISRRGWAPALGARRVRARTTVIAAPRAIDRCGGSSIRPPTPP